MKFEDFKSEFTEEDLAENEEADDLIFDNVEWEKIPPLVKKRLWTRKMINIQESQGTMELVDGFSFDSDSKIKLYNW
ncbi:MAG: hypothetical protein J6U21_11490 [Bacteroidales bacterium]|nr:hypothetical protein [Bacteroidales bacterium]